MNEEPDIPNKLITEAIRKAAEDKDLVAQRFALARFIADTFTNTGVELRTIGEVFGSDRLLGESPMENGSDEVVAVGLLLRIAGQLVSSTTDLFEDRRHYAAASLLRQLLEIEYLAWAFETRDGDAEKWLRSNRDERRNFFTPAKLRKASKGKFRGEDYGYHCELGGHPVPDSIALFTGDQTLVQVLLLDLLSHCGGVWDHLMRWAGDNEWSVPLISRGEEVKQRYDDWRVRDSLVSPPQKMGEQDIVPNP